ARSLSARLELRRERQHLPRFRERVAPRRGEGDTLGAAPDEQLDSEGALELGQRDADTHLRDVAAFGRRLEGSRLRGRDEVLELLERVTRCCHTAILKPDFANADNTVALPTWRD